MNAFDSALKKKEKNRSSYTTRSATESAMEELRASVGLSNGKSGSSTTALSLLKQGQRTQNAFDVAIKKQSAQKNYDKIQTAYKDWRSEAENYGKQYANTLGKSNGYFANSTKARENSDSAYSSIEQKKNNLLSLLDGYEGIYGQDFVNNLVKDTSNVMDVAGKIKSAYSDAENVYSKFASKEDFDNEVIRYKNMVASASPVEKYVLSSTDVVKAYNDAVAKRKEYAKNPQKYTGLTDYEYKTAGKRKGQAALFERVFVKMRLERQGIFDDEQLRELRNYALSVATQEQAQARIDELTNRIKSGIDVKDNEDERSLWERKLSMLQQENYTNTEEELAQNALAHRDEWENEGFLTNVGEGAKAFFSDLGFLIAPGAKLMLDGERLSIYNWIAKNEGKEKANEYLKVARMNSWKELTEKSAQELSSIRKKSETLADIHSLFSNIVTDTFVAPGAFVEDIYNAAAYGKDFNPVNGLSNSLVSSLSKDQEEMIRNAMRYGGGKEIEFALGIVQSVGSSMLSKYLFGAGSSPLMGSTAAAKKAQENYERGVDPAESILSSLAVGAAEMLFEWASFDKIVKAGTSESTKELIKNILKQMGVEASEEVFTEISNYITDAVIQGANSPYRESIRKYMDDGMSRNEAEKQAFVDAVGNVAEAGAGGFLSGGVHMAALSSLYSAKKGNQFSKSSVDTLVDFGKNSTNENAKDLAYKIENRIAEGKSAGGLNVARLYEEFSRYVEEENKNSTVEYMKENGIPSLDAEQIGEELAEYVREDKKMSKTLLDKISQNKVLQNAARMIDGIGDTKIAQTNEINARIEQLREIATPQESSDRANLYKDAAQQFVNDVVANSPSLDKTSVTSISADGNTTLKSNGKPVDFVRVQRIDGKDTQIVVRNSAGAEETVKVSNVMFGNPSTAIMVDTAISLDMNAPAANQFINGFNGDNVATYVSGFVEQYQAGKLGLGTTYRGGMSGRLSQQQRATAAELGRISTIGQQIETDSKGRIKATIENAVEIGRRFGVNVIVVPDDSSLLPKNKRGVRADGMYNGGTIYIAENSKDPVGFVMKHEFVHYLADRSGVFGDLTSDIMKSQVFYTWLKSRGFNSVSEMVKDLDNGTYKGVYDNLSPSEKEAKLREEVFADFCGDVIFGGRNSFTAELLGQMDEATGNRFVRAVKNFFQWLRDKFVKGSPEYKDIQRIEKTFIKVAEDAKKFSQAEKMADKPMSPSDETIFSFARDAELQENAVSKNDVVPKNVLSDAGKARAEIKSYMESLLDKLNLPEDKEGNVLVGNSSYGKSAENTTVCIRSLVQDALINDVEIGIGRKLTMDEALYVSQAIGMYTGIMPCTYCYVAADRLAWDESLGSFLDDRDIIFDSVKNGLSLEESTERMRHGRTKTPKLIERATYWYNEAKNGRLDGRLERSDLAGVSYTASSIEKGRAKLKNDTQRKEFNFAIEYARSASHAKKRVAYTAYNGNILSMPQRTVNNLNSMFGLRMYSYSDYSPAFVLENMQMITDAAVRGMKVLAYTKELDFVRIFAGTGANINISVFGYEQNGQIGEDAMQGAPWEASRLLRDQYDNVGITFVATSDNLVEWAMQQDWIDVVIPYHSVFSGGTKVGKILGFKDYKAIQEDIKNGNWRKGIDAKSIYPNVHNNDLISYVDALRENNLKPRFEKWLNGYEDYLSGNITEEEFRSQNPNYMKLVNETRLSADGSKVVQPIFDVQAAKDSIKRMADNGGYNPPIGGDIVIQNEVADMIVEDLRNGKRASTNVPTTEDTITYNGKVFSFPEAENIVNETFYSKMVNVLSEMKQDKISASGVIPYLTSRGVKQEEIKWSGIADFLYGKKSVTKADLKSFADGSLLRIGEARFGKEYDVDVAARLERSFNEWDDRLAEVREEYLDVVSKTNEELEKIGMRKISDYDVFNAERYGGIESQLYEDFTLLVADELGRDFVKNAESVAKAYDEAIRKKNSALQMWNAYRNTDTSKWKRYSLDGGDNYREFVFVLPNSDYSNDAMKEHWGQEANGVIAHARVQDFETTDGEQMLFIDEIQSDWHNAGAAEGYMSKAETNIVNATEQRKNELRNREKELYEEIDELLLSDDAEELVSAYQRKFDINTKESAVANLSSAAPTHFDRFSRTFPESVRNGTAFAKFESLISERANVIDELDSIFDEQQGVNLVPDAPFKTTYTDFAIKRLLRLAVDGGYDSIGWTTAQQQVERWSDEYAEGYRIEYDQDIPKFLNKYGKQWGGKVNQAVLSNGETVWNFTIPDEMKKSVVNDKQPLYSYPSESERKDGLDNAIYIPDGVDKNGNAVSFIDLILDGTKKGETRTHKGLTRKWVGIAKDGYVYGRVRLGEPVEITKNSPEYKDAYIQDTNYDIKGSGTKYYYPILEKEDFRDDPKPIIKNGNYGGYEGNRYSYPSEKIRQFVNGKIPASELGDISREDLIDFLQQNNELNPSQIARLTEQDFQTPAMQKRQGTNNGNAESNFGKSLQGSSIFDDRLKADTNGNTFVESYQNITNKETLRKAQEALDNGGAGFVNQWFAKTAKESTPEDVAVGFILMYRYQQIGDYESAVAASEKVREIGTKAGQTVQLFSILDRFDPNMMQLYAQKSLDKAFEEFKKFKTDEWLAKNRGKFNLTPQDIDFIREQTLLASTLPEGREKVVRIAEIAKFIQDKVPPAPGQMLRALQRISMLFNPKTQIRNVLGNGVMIPAFVTTDFFGTGIDYLISKKTGVRTQGLNIKATGVGGAIAKGAREAIDDYKRGINSKMELDRFEIGQGKSFNENTNFRALNAAANAMNRVDQITGFMLDFGDRPFFEAWYANSLQKQMKANKVTTPTEQMVQIAMEEALQRTWQDNNGFSKFAQTMKKVLNVVSVPKSVSKIGLGGIAGFGLGDVLIKFTKTPANLAKAIFDFSPANLVYAVAHDAERFTTALKRGEDTTLLQKRLVDNLSKGLTGSIIYVIAAFLAANGLIKGKRDDDRDVAAFEQYIQGIPAYSVKIGNKWFSYDWSQPIGAMLGTVANYYQGKEEGSPAYQRILDAVSAGGNMLVEQSFLKSLSDFFSNVGEDGPVTALWESIVSDPSTNIPTLFGQFANLFDPYRRKTYDKNPIKNTWNTIKAKTPGVRNTIAKDKDVLGRDVPNSQNSFFNAFFNPANTNTNTSTPVTNEVYRLYKSTSDKSAIPQKAGTYVTVLDVRQNLSANQQLDYQVVYGNTADSILKEMFRDTRYTSLTDEEKLAVVKKVYEYCNSVAKASVVYDYEIANKIAGDTLTEESYKRMTDDEKRNYTADYFFKSKKKYIDKTPSEIVDIILK